VGRGSDRLAGIDDAFALAAALGLGGALEVWREELPGSRGFPPDRFPLPGAAEVEAAGRRFGFAAGVVEALVQATPAWQHPAARRLARHAQWRIVERYDPRAVFDAWPVLDGAPDPGIRLLWAATALSLVPHVEALHRARGIPEAVTAQTMWDLGQQVHEHRLVHGHPGLGVMFFVRHYLAGHLVGLGRLQYQVAYWMLPDHGPLRRGDPVIDLHVPESGPLDPQAVDDSLARAGAFFPRHFPEHRARVATCESWLLDPQLARCLPPESNIVRFQRRFTAVPVALPVASGAFRFVFHADGIEAADGTVPHDALDRLPRRTTLQRALADHVRGGGRWWMTAGWFPFPAPLGAAARATGARRPSPAP
jgi:hypothetical protein